MEPGKLGGIWEADGRLFGGGEERCSSDTRPPTEDVLPSGKGGAQTRSPRSRVCDRHSCESDLVPVLQVKLVREGRRQNKEGKPADALSGRVQSWPVTQV